MWHMGHMPPELSAQQVQDAYESYNRALRPVIRVLGVVGGSALALFGAYQMIEDGPGVKNIAIIGTGTAAAVASPLAYREPGRSASPVDAPIIPHFED